MLFTLYHYGFIHLFKIYQPIEDVMPQLSKFLSSQGRLFEAMIQLDYPSPAHIYKGICFGVAHMGKQAMLAEDIQTFDDRFDRMFAAIKTDDEMENLSILMNNKLRNYIFSRRPYPSQQQIDEYWGQLFTEEIIIEKNPALHKDIDLRAFFDGIEIYNFQFMHPELFSEKIPFCRKPELSLSLTLPTSLEEKKIQCVKSFSGIYTLTELTQYLHTLRQTLEGPNPFLHPVSLILRGFHHTTHVGYCPKKHKWIFIDANSKFENRLRLSLSRTIASSHEMAGILFKNFWANDLVGFTTEVSVTGDQVEAFKPYLTQWHQTPAMQDMLTVTRERASRVGEIDLHDKVENDFWLLNASQCGHTQTVRELLAAGANPNLTSTENAGPLYVAAVNNHTDIVEILLEGKADVDLLTDDLATALFPAVRNANVEMINLLISHSVKIDHVRKDGLTALRLAIKHNYADVVSVLLKANAKVTNDDLKFANAKGSSSVVALLTNHMASLSSVSSSSFSVANSLSEFGLLKISDSDKKTPLCVPDDLAKQVPSTNKKDNKEDTGCYACTIM